MLAAVSSALAAGTYPAYKKKILYAENDIRGKQAPKFHVETWLTANKPETKGKVVLIDFWATWCGSCKELIPELNKWHKKFGKDLVIIGVSDEDVKTLKGFMKTTVMNYAVATDTKQNMSKKIGVQAVPHALVITPDGIVRWQGFPGSEEEPLTDALLEQIIKASKAK